MTFLLCLIIHVLQFNIIETCHVLVLRTEINGRPLAIATETSAGRLNNTSKEPSWQLIILYFLVVSLTFEASCLQYDHVKYHIHFTGSGSFYFLSTVICVIRGLKMAAELMAA